MARPVHRFSFILTTLWANLINDSLIFFFSLSFFFFFTQMTVFDISFKLQEMSDPVFWESISSCHLLKNYFKMSSTESSLKC